MRFDNCPNSHQEFADANMLHNAVTDQQAVGRIAYIAKSRMNNPDLNVRIGSGQSREPNLNAIFRAIPYYLYYQELHTIIQYCNFDIR